MSVHSHNTPTADVSVRPAIEQDAPALGEIQVQAWRNLHAERLPSHVLAALDAEQFASAWRIAITSPPSPKHRVLTACSGPHVAGFAALAPGAQDDPTGEVVELAVGDDYVRNGHGSRLLAACTDILTSTGAKQARIWVAEGDDARDGLVRAAGFGPIGVKRVLDVAGEQVTEHAWAAQLRD